MKRMFVIGAVILTVLSYVSLSFADEPISLIDEEAPGVDYVDNHQQIENYVVQRGDTLGEIAIRLQNMGVDMPLWGYDGLVETLARANNIDANGILHIGDSIYIPPVPFGDDAIDLETWRESVIDSEEMAQLRAGELSEEERNLEKGAIVDLVRIKCDWIVERLEFLMAEGDAEEATKISVSLVNLHRNLQDYLALHDEDDEATEAANLLSEHSLLLASRLEYFGPRMRQDNAASLVEAMQRFRAVQEDACQALYEEETWAIERAFNMDADF